MLSPVEIVLIQDILPCLGRVIIVMGHATQSLIMTL
jgi:hypothetical protein